MKNYNRYLLSGRLEEDWGFYITTVGYTKINKNQSYPLNSQHPDTHKFNWDSGRILDGYYLVFISMGEGVFESAKAASCHIKEGTCFILFPGVWHRYKPDIKSGWEEYWVGFKGYYPDRLMKNFDPANPFIKTGRSDNLLKLFHALMEQVQQAAPGYHQVISGITLQILGFIQAVSQYHEISADGDTRLVEEAKFLLRESVSANIAIEEVLQKLPAGYSKLRKDFKRLTGRSPNQYLLNLRLEKVKELLTNTSLSISEIAYQTGFESVSYLSKIFKKKNRRGPKSYRDEFGL
jgi:AraC-like DNA-binding protein